MDAPETETLSGPLGGIEDDIAAIGALTDVYLKLTRGHFGSADAPTSRTADALLCAIRSIAVAMASKSMYMYAGVKDADTP